MNPPVYLHSIHLQNVRCFRDATINFFTPDNKLAKWTVILGNNGTGKTTVLRCIAYAEPVKPVNQFIIAGVVYASEIMLRWNFIRDELMVANINLELSLNTQHTIFPNIGIEPPITITVRTHGEPPPQEIGFAYPNYIIPENSPSRMFMIGYGASRTTYEGFEVYKPHDFYKSKTLFDENAFLFNLETWLIESILENFGFSVLETKTKINLYEISVRILKICLPNNFITDVRVERGKAEVKTNLGWIKISNLSLGHRTILAWIIDFARHLCRFYPDSANPLAEPAVCLVDEFDLHLHPTWQRDLMGYLDEIFPQTQFIVTAHSPLVAQAAAGNNANIVLLKSVHKEGQEFAEVIAENNPEEIRGYRVDQILTSDLFGLDSEVDRRTQQMENERDEILSKEKLTTEEKIRVREIESELKDTRIAYERKRDPMYDLFLRKWKERMNGGAMPEDKEKAAQIIIEEILNRN